MSGTERGDGGTRQEEGKAKEAAAEQATVLSYALATQFLVLTERIVSICLREFRYCPLRVLGHVWY